MSDNDMLDTVISILTQKAGLPAGPVTPTATLKEAGVDSMAIAVLAMIIEDEYGLVVTESALSTHSTIAELAEFIEQHQAAKA